MSMKMTRPRDHANCVLKWANSHTMTSRHCSVCGKGGIGMTQKVDGSIRSIVPRPDVRKCTFEITRCTRRYQGDVLA